MERRKRAGCQVARVSDGKEHAMLARRLSAYPTAARCEGAGETKDAGNHTCVRP